MDFLQDLITGSFENFLKRLVDESVSLFLSLLVDVMSTTNRVLDMPVVNSAILYAQAVAAVFIGLKAAYDALTVYILRAGGDPDADPSGLLIRTVRSVAIVSSVPWLVKWIFQLGTSIANDVAKLPGVDYTASGLKSPVQQLINGLLSADGIGVLMLIGIIFATIMFLIIIIQTYIRSAELAVLAGTGAFMATGLVDQNSGMFNHWWRELISLSMTQAIQIFMLKVSFMSLSFFGGSVSNSLLMFIALLWVTYKSPAALKQMIHATGLGGVAGGVAQSAGSAYLMRRIMRRG